MRYLPNVAARYHAVDVDLDEDDYDYEDDEEDEEELVTENASSGNRNKTATARVQVFADPLREDEDDGRPAGSIGGFHFAAARKRNSSLTPEEIARAELDGNRPRPPNPLTIIQVKNPEKNLDSATNASPSSPSSTTGLTSAVFFA